LISFFVLFVWFPTSLSYVKKLSQCDNLLIKGVLHMQNVYHFMAFVLFYVCLCCVVLIRTIIIFIYCSQTATSAISRTNNKQPRRTAPVQQNAKQVGIYRQPNITQGLARV